MENKKLKVIGIILTYKHAKYLESVYKSLPKGVFDEIIISNDDTGDNIEEIAQRLGIRCFSHPRLNYGGNIKYGLQKALEMGGDYMIEIHGDGQYSMEKAGAGIEKMNQGYDFILGSRFTDILQPLRDGMSLARYLANIGLSFIDRLVFRVNLSEFHSGFRIYSRRQLSAIDLSSTANDHLFSFQLISLTIYNRLKIGEIPIRCDYRKEHSSIKISWAIRYAFQTFLVLAKFILARLGFKTRLFI